MFVSGFTLHPLLPSFHATNGRLWTEPVEMSSSNLSCFCGATTHRDALLLYSVVGCSATCMLLAHRCTPFEFSPHETADRFASAFSLGISVHFGVGCARPARLSVND